LNPAGSKKDLIAKFMLEEAEQQGLLKPGQTVVEVTSGNTGNGLAMVCAVKGYPFIAIMSKGNSPERVAMTRAMGGEVILVDQDPGTLGRPRHGRRSCNGSRKPPRASWPSARRFAPISSIASPTRARIT
jgi:cysteine synthase